MLVAQSLINGTILHFINKPPSPPTSFGDAALFILVMKRKMSYKYDIINTSITNNNGQVIYNLRMPLVIDRGYVTEQVPAQVFFSFCDKDVTKQTRLRAKYYPTSPKSG